VNDFASDNAYQRGKRDSILVPYLYERYFHGLYRLCDHDRTLQLSGVDTIISTMRQTVTIDEKIVRKQHTALALETWSCAVPGYVKPGWMFNSDADRLLYCFAFDEAMLDCWWFDMQKLIKWFWPIERTFKLFRRQERNKTAGRVVPLKNLRASGSLIGHFQIGRKADGFETSRGLESKQQRP